MMATTKTHRAPDFKDFANDTTIHGIKDVATGRTPFITIIWVLLLLGCMGAVIYEICQIAFGFLDRPKATQIKQLFQDTYPFPDTLFCPEAWINGSRVRDLNMSKEEVTYALSFMPMLRVRYPMNLTNQTVNRFNQIMMENDFDHVFELYESISVDSEQIIFCSSCKNWPARRRMTEYGVCYQINLKDARRFHLDDFLFMPYFQYEPTPQDKSVLPRYAPFNLGEKLLIGINQNDFFDARTEHLKLNNSYLVKISPSKQDRLNQDGGTCLTEEEFRERNISQEVCFSDCEQRVFGPTCWNFVHVGYAYNYFHMEAIYKDVNSTVPVPLWNALIHDSVDPSLWSACQERERPRYDKCASRCLPPCQEWVYETTVLTVNGRRLMTYTKEASFTVAFSYQVKTGTFLVEEKATYTWHTFVSNIGGQMGLWLGISVLSICQLAFFTFRWVEYRLQMRAEQAIHRNHMLHLQFEQETQQHEMEQWTYRKRKSWQLSHLQTLY